MNINVNNTDPRQMKITELKEYAKALGVKGFSKLKKQELLEAVLSAAPKAKGASDEKNEKPKPPAEKKITRPPAKTDGGEQEENKIMSGVLEVLEDGYGFLRSDNYQSGIDDVYVPQSQIRRFRLKTGDYVEGNTRMQHEGERYRALVYVQTVNGDRPLGLTQRPSFEDLTPVYPSEVLKLETERTDYAMRMIDLMAPVGKGQRGIIVAPPKAGKDVYKRQAMLDPIGRFEVLETVKRLNREQGMTVALITHYMDEAVQADRVVVVDSGRIAMEGTPRQVFPRVEELVKLGLDVPQSTYLAYMLNREGINIDSSVLDDKECADAILDWLKRDGGNADDRA